MHCDLDIYKIKSLKIVRIATQAMNKHIKCQFDQKWNKFNNS